MKKKLIGTLILTCLSMSIVGTAVLLAHHDGFSGSSKATTYFVRLNSSNAYQGVDQTIPTSSGQYALPFTYSGAQTETGYHCKLSENGTIKNSTDIQYITSVHAVWSGSYSQLKIRYSPDNSSWGEYSLLESDMETFVEGKPYFFEVTSTGGEISLSSLTIHYSCSPRGDDDLKSVKIYATNDIHGQVYPENPQEDEGRIGIGKLMTYLKDNKDGNTLLLDQGDTWQGNVYSNYNYGHLLNDAMAYVRYDARTIGNHDFDWGLDKIIDNTARVYDGYRIPTLAANVYDYNFDTKVTGTTQQSEIGAKTVSYLLDNGLKVGVVGVIGQDQITSINSLYTHDITFKEHVSIIKQEALNLRREGCDIVICTIHADESAVKNQNLGDYVDLVLCGHSHDYETSNEGDLYFAQFGEYTQYLGEITLTYDPSTTNVSTSIQTITAKGIDDEIDLVDPTIQGLISTYSEQCDALANQVIVKDMNGQFRDNREAANLMAEAVYQTAIDEGYDIDFAYVNTARHALGEYGAHSTITYGDIYQAFPFDNKVYIFDITYSEIRNEISYNNLCKADDDLYIYPGGTYKIACLDYLAFHTNSSRYYNYFPSVANYELSEMECLSKNYREILKDYLLDNDYDKDGKQLSYSNYSSSLPRFSSSTIKDKNYTVNFYLNDGSGDLYESYSVSHNVLIKDVLPENPHIRYKSFGGWYKDSDCTIPLADTDKNMDLDLYAKWTNYTPTEYGTTDSLASISSIITVYDSLMNIAEVNVWFGLSSRPYMATDEQFSFTSNEMDTQLMITQVDLYLDDDDYNLLGHGYNSISVIPEITQIDTDVYLYTYECYSTNIWFENLDARTIQLGTFIIALETYA